MRRSAIVRFARVSGTVQGGDSNSRTVVYDTDVAQDQRKVSRFLFDPNFDSNRVLKRASGRPPGQLGHPSRRQPRIAQTSGC